MKRCTMRGWIGAFALAAAVITGVIAGSSSSVATRSPRRFTTRARTPAPASRFGQINLQNPVTPIAARINWLHSWVNNVIIAIALFVPCCCST